MHGHVLASVLEIILLLPRWPRCLCSSLVALVAKNMSQNSDTVEQQEARRLKARRQGAGLKLANAGVDLVVCDARRCVNGYYQQDGTENGKPKYKHINDDPKSTISWGEAHQQLGWIINNAGGYFRWHGDYYINRQDTEKPPTDGWEVLEWQTFDGHGPQGPKFSRAYQGFDPVPTLTWL